MFKLIFFLIGLAVAIIFSALNIGNTTNISFGFKVLEDVPFFLSVLISFFLGAVFTLPFAFSVSLGARKKKRKNNARFIADDTPDAFSPEGNTERDNV